ncbi:hypothetical protein D3C84_1159910 [compost metagenome]
MFHIPVDVRVSDYINHLIRVCIRRIDSNRLHKNLVLHYASNRSGSFKANIFL